MAGLAFATRALRSRNFKLFFARQGISLIGTWMTRIAMSWLVYRLTGSAALLGVVGFASQIPALVLGPIVGVWIDRWNRHQTVVWTQALSTVQSLAPAALMLAHVITVWEMVERREDLGNAIALNSSIVNGARLVGRAIAGVVVAAVGEGYRILADGISYIAVVVALLLMRIPAASASKPKKDVWWEVRDGWRHVVASAPIRSILVNLSVVSLFGVPY